MTEQSHDPKYNFEPTILREQAEQIWTPKDQLREMQRWRRSQDTPFNGGIDIPEYYWEAQQHLEQLDRIYQIGDPDSNQIEDRDYLLFNLISYLEGAEREDDVDLNFNFLRIFYDHYLEDVDFFKEAGVKKASTVALYHPADTLRDLQGSYANHNFITSEEIKQAFDKNVRNPGLYLQELVAKAEELPTGLDPSEEFLKKAQLQLDSLRRKTSGGHFGGNSSIDMWQLGVTFKLNPHESFEGLDLVDEAKRLYRAVLHHNKSVDDDQQIPTDMENLYSIFRVFALDVAMLRQEVRSQDAVRVARYFPPGICKRYSEKYKDHHPLLTDGVIAELIVRSPSDVDKAIEDWTARADKIAAVAGALITPGLVRRLARFSNGEERVRDYVKFVSGVQERYPWVTAGDIQKISATRNDLESSFEKWSQRVLEIERLHPNDSRFPTWVVKMLAFRSGEIDTLAAEHLSKINELTEKYKDNTMVTEAFMLYWVGNSPKSYKEAAEAYLSRFEELSARFARANKEIGLDNLRQMAFRNRDPGNIDT